MKRCLLLIALISCDPPTQTKTPADTPAQIPAPQPATPAAPLPVKPARPVVDSGPRVLELKGDVLIDDKPAMVGSPITATSTIETGEGSWARITLVPHSVLAIRPLTKFTIGSSLRKRWSVQLLIGQLWSFLPKGASYEVTTANAVAGVRGTTLFVSATEPGKSAVCACDGEVEIAAAGKTRLVKSKRAHLATMVQGDPKKAKLIPLKKQPPFGHDDVEGAKLDALRDNTSR